MIGHPNFSNSSIETKADCATTNEPHSEVYAHLIPALLSGQSMHFNRSNTPKVSREEFREIMERNRRARELISSLP